MIFQKQIWLRVLPKSRQRTAGGFSQKKDCGLLSSAICAVCVIPAKRNSLLNGRKAHVVAGHWTKAQVRLAQAAMTQRDTFVSDLCKELRLEHVTLYRYAGPTGELRDYGKRVLGWGA